MGISDLEDPRLKRLVMKMLPYSFTAQWVKVKDNLAADALSRFPVDQPSLDDESCDTHAEAAMYIHFLFYSWPFFKNPDMLKEIMPPRRGNKVKENG